MRSDYFYIVNLEDIDNPFSYRMGFISEGQAVEAIDSCLGEGYYTVYKGDYLKRLKLPNMRPGKLQKYTPTEKALDPNYFRKHKIELRARGSGKQIRAHKFKALWESLPKDSESRNLIYKKGKDTILHKIFRDPS